MSSRHLPSSLHRFACVVDDISTLIWDHLDADAYRLVARYFLGHDPEWPDNHEPELWRGRWFEQIGGGGDRPEVANRFTADDLVAVTALSVNVPIRAAWRLLEDTGGRLSALLEGVPQQTDLWEVDARTIARSSEAWKLWDQLKKPHDGIGSVVAGKLLARKRPRLIPIYDSVVKQAMGAPDDWWASLHQALQDPALRTRLDEIRQQAGVSPDISLLRILDVAIWMHGR